jgi:flagellar M-ring protein FliF
VPPTPENTSTQSTRNFEIDRTLSYTRQPAGRLRRLTVAVLVDNVRTADKDGKIVEKALPQKQIDDITLLVKDAVGFDAQRGDSVNVVNASFFDDSQSIEAEEPTVWQSPWLHSLARLVFGAAVAIVLLLVVVRPLMKSLMSPALGAAAPAPALPAAALPGAPEQLAAPVVASGGANPAQLNYDQQVAAARSLVSQDPKRVAQVVKNWVATDE